MYQIWQRPQGLAEPPTLQTGSAVYAHLWTEHWQRVCREQSELQPIENALYGLQQKHRLGHTKSNQACNTCCASPAPCTHLA